MLRSGASIPAPRGHLARTVSAIIAAFALAACGSSSATTSAASHSSSGPSARTSLEIAYWPHGQEGRGRRAWTLRCHPPGGDHPDPIRACAELTPTSFAPRRSPCPLIILRGGPAASVHGQFRGQTISQLVRPSCGTAWHRLHFLLTGH